MGGKAHDHVAANILDPGVQGSRVVEPRRLELEDPRTVCSGDLERLISRAAVDNEDVQIEGAVLAAKHIEASRDQLAFVQRANNDPDRAHGVHTLPRGGR